MKSHRATFEISVNRDLPGWIFSMLHENEGEGREYGFEDSAYQFGRKVWKATSLYEAAAKQQCRLFRMDLRCFDATWQRFASMRVVDFAYHLRRALLADLTKPILLSPNGSVLDGAHRICRALASGVETLPAMRLKVMPDADEVLPEDDPTAPQGEP